jgi:transposase-like protein
MRKRYTAAFKAQVVLELLKEERPVSKISSEYGVHPNQLYQWKTQALKNLPRLFDEEQAKAKVNQANQKLDELYAEIGRLTTQVNWLKKKSGLEFIEK